ncbi:carbohydrate-binding module family 20 domain-containing protein [Andreprevotia chitinilytica]|uniref:carbohydrate-binding module family 20 domain-containing protein n=1 Tax=Andreprevotia chitinilytica TaxID=396808 RepID=UPI0005543C28|nr:carbohydrate-binding module family 20 domain-containing protein [Andreprevotia chitinilytica]
MYFRLRPLAAGMAAAAACYALTAAAGTIPAAHVYHNHMPNFWPFYGVDVNATYNATAIGAPIRYTYDGQVINLKTSPPTGYTYYLPSVLGGAIMPHDDLVSYYSANAKTGAYQYWPQQVAGEVQTFAGGNGQIHVTMSGAVVNDVNSLENLQNVPGYTNPSWGASWISAYNGLKTNNGNRTLDVIHFTGHHSMGPLVGPDYFLKDLIYQNATLAQSYFLGSNFTASHGFFPTELGFSERLIPTLSKLGVQWSVMGNNHFSRTLKDYPYSTYDPTGDTLISPPNRADLQNTSNVGAWVANGMAHEQQNIINKFPFASTPHWVRHVDPATGEVTQVAGIPVSQNGSWQEGWDGSATADEYVPYASQEARQFYVIAHDGDNSGGRSGSLDTWQAGYNTTCAGNGYCLGIDEYLKKFPIPATDIQHVQDGSWVDTRDSSSDPTWYHWHLPFMIWAGQFSAFNTATGMNLAPKKNLKGVAEGATVSFEYGWHYLERNFALLQAAMYYAKASEQIWLDGHPSYWSPTTALDKQVTYAGNQLNPWMISYPVKGDAANDYKSGANPAELAWYFLLPAMDSGFGYYDENKDDDVKPTLAFNNSLAFSKPYVNANLAKVKTGPSVWWPQRYPYNPGSVNGSKAEGWTVQHYNSNFAIYTYAFDALGISSMQVKIRPHTSNTLDAADDTWKVYDPAAMAGKTGLSINPANVGAWKSYPMTMRDLKPVMNGVDWNANVKATMQVLPAQEIGNLYYSYISDYRNQLVDYYIEATDAGGNVTRTDIQQVFVGAGTYSTSTTGSGYVEDVNGTVQGINPFLVIDTTVPTVPGTPVVSATTTNTVSLSWTASTDNVGVTGYKVFRDSTQIGTSSTNSYTDTGLTASTIYSYTVEAYDAANNTSAASGAVSATTQAPDTTPPSVPTGVTVGTVTSSSVVLSWTASTDNVGVTGYKILRNGTQIGTSTGTSYTDATAVAGTTYSYSVQAYDAASNTSAASAAVSATTLAGNSATVYYQPASSWTTVNIHYGINGTWTTSPGVAMTLACTGWYSKTINLGSYSTFQVDFNNGSTWDNNSGINYQLSTGVWTVSGGKTGTTNPCVADTTPPSVPTGLTAGTIKATSVALTWTASTDNVAVTGYKILRNGTQIGTSTTASYSDTTAAASTTYSYTVQAYDAAGNVSAASTALSVTTPAAATCTTINVTFTIANANTVTGQNLYVVGNQTALGSWTPASGFALTIQGSGANVPWTGTVALPIGTAIQYKYVKWNGTTAVWESNQSTTSGNREATTSSTCGTTQSLSDGNF